MITRTGDLFTTKLQAVGHGVNLEGVMGAGVAKIVRQQFPEAYDAYATLCSHRALFPGAAQMVNTDFGHGKVIVNMATQLEPGPNAELRLIKLAAANAATSLKWYRGVEEMAIPKIGCGIGGLDWHDVLPLLLDVEDEYEFEFEVWEL